MHPPSSKETLQQKKMANRDTINKTYEKKMQSGHTKEAKPQQPGATNNTMLNMQNITSRYHRPNPNTLPLTVTSILPLRFPPTQSYYTNGSFTPPYGVRKWNITVLEFSMDHYKSILLLTYPIPQYSQSMIIYTPNHHEPHQDAPNGYIHFIDRLNNIYLLLDHIRNPSSQYNHPDKFLITQIINMLKTSHHNITIRKVSPHKHR